MLYIYTLAHLRNIYPLWPWSLSPTQTAELVRRNMDDVGPKEKGLYKKHKVVMFPVSESTEHVSGVTLTESEPTGPTLSCSVHCLSVHNGFLLPHRGQWFISGTFQETKHTWCLNVLCKYTVTRVGNQNLFHRSTLSLNLAVRRHNSFSFSRSSSIRTTKKCMLASPLCVAADSRTDAVKRLGEDLRRLDEHEVARGRSVTLLL